MRKSLLAVAAAAVAFAPTGTAEAQTADAEVADEAQWIHVRVDETEGARVRVNVPASVAELAIEMAGEEALEGEHLRWESETDVTLEEIRRLWRELRDAGDAQFVETRDGDEHVRVFREGDRIHVHVDEGETEKVRVEMPSASVDALLGGEGDELDLRGALKELARSGSPGLVRIEDGDASVRVWIDTRSTQDGQGGRSG